MNFDQLKKLAWLTGLCVAVAIYPNSVLAQSYVFADGFESGTLCGWTASTASTPTSFSIFTNPTVPLALRANTSCGTLDFLSTKSSSGLPLSVDHIIYSTHSREMLLELDEGQVSKIISLNDGISFETQWTSPTRMTLTAVSSNGQFQVSTLVDFELPELPATSIFPEITWTPRVSSESPEEFSTSISNDPHKINLNSMASLAGNLDIIVNRCGQPVTNAETQVVITAPSGPVRLSGTMSSAGVYGHAIPNFSTPAGETLENICSGFAEAAGFSCEFADTPALFASFTFACMRLAAVIDILFGGPTGEGIGIFGACMTGFEGLSVYCSTIGYSSGGGPSIPEFVCDNVSEVVDNFPGNNIQAKAIVTVPGFGSHQQTATMPLLGPYPAVSFTLPANTDVRSLVISPPDPAPSQGYSAVAEISCAPANSNITVSIIGTDGYTNSVTCQISSAGTCTLIVPGAEEGVRDTVSVNFGTQLLRRTGIVF